MSLKTVSSSSNKKNKVIVIGAGASGIAAAKRLQNADFDVTILEARNRIGGRIWTDHNLAQHPVELGAEFIHGSQVLTWKLLKKFKMKTTKPIKDKQVYAHLGKKFDRFDDLIEEDWEDDIWEASEEWIEAKKADTSLRVLLDSKNWLLPHDSRIAKLINNLYACDYGADLSELGIYGLLESSYRGDADEDGDFRLVDGYSELMQKMAKGLHIKMDTPVEAITYSANGVTISDKNGKTHYADKVVITLPLAILKQNSVRFSPPLPDEKIKAIDTIGAAKVNKIILGFSEAFWKKKMALFYTYLDTQIWWRPNFGFDNEAPILTALIGGTSGKYLSGLSEQDAIEIGLQHLKKIFGKQVNETYQWGKFINWGNDPYSQMGYSYNPVGVSGMREILAKSVDNRLYFAGEATNTIRPATVHGAIESGWRVADEIIGSST